MECVMFSYHSVVTLLFADSVFIGNLSYETEEASIKNMLEENDMYPIGVRVITRDGESRGY